MLERKEPADFRVRPEGGYLAGDTWLYFCARPDLYGFALWGSPEPDDMAALVRLLEVELDRAPHAALVDVKDLTAALPASFDELARYFFAHAGTLADRVTRSAIVKGSGMTAAIAAGFLESVPPTFAASLYADVAGALEGLGFDRSFASAIERAKEEARAVPGVVRALRAWLDDHLAETTIDDAARALATATRTLQRRLTEASTSFAEEVRLARVRAAKRMLAETDLPITTIAIDVGCSSPQHLSTLFRQYVGDTPSAWRALVLLNVGGSAPDTPAPDTALALRARGASRPLKRPLLGPRGDRGRGRGGA
ncbi:MAG: helix-turn-helix transcriptional regulator [Labilithrix sp.]|nr:helix-turn-helix transcriptional regulator [Labilithrix sp.]MCW5810515.1 helix-turn-helix transcriptional regulator [Labilithrix sp.]